MTMRIAAAALLGSIAMVARIGMGSAAAQPGGDGGQLSQQDRIFMIDDAQADQAEIAAGQRAV